MVHESLRLGVILVLSVQSSIKPPFGSYLTLLLLKNVEQVLHTFKQLD